MRAMIAGIGNMGSALADALLAQSIPVTVWNRTPEKCRPAVQAGANQAGSVTEGAESCDVLITCMSDSQSVHEAVVHDDVAKRMKGKVFVQLSQATPDQSLEFNEWAIANEIGYLDGSIMGLPISIRENNCMIVYSGDRGVFNSCFDVLNALGSKPRLVGEKPGIATAFDKAFFSAYYAHLAGLIHGAAICQSTGAPLETYFELMINVLDWTLPDSIYAQMITSGDYSTEEATLEVHAYAYAQVAPLCEKIGVDAALPRVIQDLLEKGIDDGHGLEEIASLIEVLGARKG